MVEIIWRGDEQERMVERPCWACGRVIEFTLTAEAGGWGSMRWYARATVQHTGMATGAWSESMNMHGDLYPGPELNELRMKMIDALNRVLWATGCWRG